MENQDKINRRLRGEMSAKEQKEFDKKLKQDSKLAADFEFNQEMSDFFEDENPELEKNLENLGDQYFPNNPAGNSAKKWLLLLPLLFISGIGIWFLFPSDTQPEVEPPVKEISLPTSNPPESKETKSEEKTEIILPATDSEEKPVEQKIVPEYKPELMPKKEEQLTAPIAYYEVNKDLENIMRENVRDAAVTTVTIPKNGAQIAIDSKFFELQGTTNKKPPYKLVIYSNRKFDFDNDYPILKREVQGVKNEENIYDFKFKAKTTFLPGLYYILLQNEGGELMSVSKFTVK